MDALSLLKSEQQVAFAFVYLSLSDGSPCQCPFLVDEALQTLNSI